MTALAQGQQSSAIYILRNAEPYDCVFNDQSHGNYVGGLAGDDGITGLDSPEIRESADVLVEADGGLHGNFYAGRRPITLTAQVFDSTVAARESKLARIKRASYMLRSNGQLIFFPGDPSVVATTRENLVPNGSFEYDTASATPALWSNSSVAQWTTAQFRSTTGTGALYGSRMLQYSATKDATATSRTFIIGTQPSLASVTPGTAGLISVEPGAVYSFRSEVFFFNPPDTGGGTVLRLYFFDANGVGITNFSSNTVAAGTSGAQTLSRNGATAPTNATYAGLAVIGDSTTSGDTIDLRIDGVSLVREAAAGAFFDGDSTNSSWLGVRGQSASVNLPNGKVLTTLRRQQPVRFSGIGWSKGAFLSMVAADPRIYSSAIYDYTVAKATDLTLENQGDTESPPIRIRVNGPGTDPTVKCTANGVARNIVFSGLTLTAGHWVDIDVVNRTVVDDTGASQYGKLDFLNTTWWGLPPGPTNTVRVDWASGSTSASTLQIRYRDAWM